MGAKHRQMSFILLIITVVMLMFPFGSVFASGEKDNTVVSLTKYLTGARIVVDGNVYNNTYLNADREFVVELDWDLGPERLTRTPTLVYSFPGTIKVGDIEDTVFYDNDGVRDGVYSVKNNILSVAYDDIGDDYVSSTEASFGFNATWNSEAIESRTVIRWGNGLSTSVKFDDISVIGNNVSAHAGGTVITGFTWPEEFMSVLQWDATSSKWVIPANTFGFDENNQLPSYALGFMGWFPTSLITNDGVSVPLTWDFNGLPGMLYEGTYVLSPTLADGYELAEGVDCSIALRFSDSVSEDFVNEVLPRHVVQGLTPKGCRMNIYNYTASGIPEGANDWPLNPYGVAGGIGYKHLLAFNSPANWGDWNMYTDSARPVTDIVQPVLRDGFPVLNLGSKTDFGGYSGYVNGANSELKTEWLEYLLSRNEAYGKTVYADVTGLFQKDEDGYYYYDSSKNYAVMGEDGHSIVLYDSPGGGHASSNNYGQFFPFNPPEQVFNAENQNISESSIWPLTYTGVDAVSSGNGSFYNVKLHEFDMDYFMGMGLDVGFMQPTGGIVPDTGDPMEFTFSGDDDVWLFIDDVLVADLGGVHDKGVFSVNFHTGEVVVNDGYFDKQGNSLTTRHTLKSAFERAGLYDANDFNGDTFADDTAHRIRFFYMERGAGASNLSLRFNVIEPDTGNIKITKSIQEGEDVNQVFNFEMRLDDHGVNGPRGDLMFNGGVAEFQMSPGDELIVSDLLAGMHYEIVETDSGGYIPVMENAEGEIIFDQTIDVSCYNSLQEKPPVPGDKPELPATGSSGIGPLVIFGSGCILFGLFVLRRKAD